MNRLLRWLRGPSFSRELNDPRRSAIIVSWHAEGRAGERYRVSKWVVIADVATAIAEKRIARRSPSIPVQKARRGARLAWTEDLSRIYMIYKRQASWVVITVLPTDRTAAAAQPTPVFRASQGLTAVAAALELARDRMEGASR